MKKARLRALTRCFFNISLSLVNSCRNEESPTEGIDTFRFASFPQSPSPCRNEESPTEGIDTLIVAANLVISICRNEESPTEGIDTLEYSLLYFNQALSRNEESPTEGIDTFMTNLISIFLMIVEMKKARLRALTPKPKKTVPQN